MVATINRNKPIGVFDSGLGGLTVIKELMRQLPNEEIVYFGDTARVPYGTKSKESIVRFSRENIFILLKYQVKLIVVACNTASSLALPSLRSFLSIPLLGVIEPGAQKAVEVTKNKRIGVIATTSTINSQEYTKKIKGLDDSVRVINQECPLFVPLAEEGWFNKKITSEVAHEYLKKIRRSKVDTLILGCTHYPLLRPVIKKVMGQDVVLVDSAKEVARKVKQLLVQTAQTRIIRRCAKQVFLVSDEPKHFQELAKRFLGCDIKNVKRSSYV